MNRQRIDVRMKLDLGRDLADQKTAACTDWLSARLLRRLEREDRYDAVAVAAAAAGVVLRMLLRISPTLLILLMPTLPTLLLWSALVLTLLTLLKPHHHILSSPLLLSVDAFSLSRAMFTRDCSEVKVLPPSPHWSHL